MTPLAEGDTGLGMDGADDAGPTKEIDGPVVEGLRADPGLGVPDVEVHHHRSGGGCFVDDMRVACRVVVRSYKRTQWRCCVGPGGFCLCDSKAHPQSEGSSWTVEEKRPGAPCNCEGTG